MRRTRLVAAQLTLVLLTATAAHGQQRDPYRLTLTTTVHAGGAAFTRFQNVTLETTDPVSASYPASIGASTAATLGADLTLWFRPWLGARLDLSYAPSNFEIRLGEEDREAVLGEETDYRRLEYSDLSMFDLNGALVLAPPIRSSHVAPYAFVGGGAAYLTADDRDSGGLEHAFDGRGTRVFWTGMAGVGVKIPLAEARVSLSFEVADRVFRSPIRSGDDRVLLETDELRIVNRAHPSAVDSNAHWTHAVGITAGLSFATGTGAPPDRVGR